MAESAWTKWVLVKAQADAPAYDQSWMPEVMAAALA